MNPELKVRTTSDPVRLITSLTGSSSFVFPSGVMISRTNLLHLARSTHTFVMLLLYGVLGLPRRSFPITFPL